MKQILTIILVFIVVSAIGQTTIKKSSIDSGGASASIGSIAMVYSIGESDIQEKSTGDIHVSEGFISSCIATMVGLKEYSKLEGVTVYPNPTIDFVTVSFPRADDYEITLFDNTGKQTEIVNSVGSDTQEIDMSRLSSGVYMVLVKNTGQQKFNTYKIIKK